MNVVHTKLIQLKFMGFVLFLVMFLRVYELRRFQGYNDLLFVRETLILDKYQRNPYLLHFGSYTNWHLFSYESILRYDSLF